MINKLIVNKSFVGLGPYNYVARPSRDLSLENLLDARHVVRVSYDFGDQWQPAVQTGASKKKKKKKKSKIGKKREKIGKRGK